MLHPRHTKKRWFTVHIHANRDDARIVVNRLREHHELVRCSDGRQRFQTFDVLIAPKEFRKIQKELPRTITIAYEPKTPDT